MQNSKFSYHRLFASPFSCYNNAWIANNLHFLLNIKSIQKPILLWHRIRGAKKKKKYHEMQSYFMTPLTRIYEYLSFSLLLLSTMIITILNFLIFKRTFNRRPCFFFSNFDFDFSHRFRSGMNGFTDILFDVRPFSGADRGMLGRRVVDE